MRSRGAAAAVSMLVLLLVPLTGCVPASPDTDTYRDAAAQTLGTAVSEVATVEKLLRLLADGDMLRPFAVTQLRYSEDGLEKSTSWFSGLNPPVGSDPLDRRAGRLLEDAGDLVADARVAVHRDQPGRYPTIADDLAKLGTKLERLEGRVS